MVSRTLKSRAAAAVLAGLGMLGCGNASEGTPRRTPGSGGDGGACADCPAGHAGEDGTAGTSSGGTSSGGTSSGGTSSGQTGGEAGSGEAGAPSVAVPSIALRSISISQAHELPLMVEGAAVAPSKRPAPLIAGKRSLVRAFVDLEPGFSSRPLLGVLDLQNGGQVSSFVSELAPTKSSLQDDLATSFVFDVPGSDLASATTYRVRLLEGDTREIARFPQDAFGPLGAKRVEPFELVLVPLVISGHAPKLDAGELNDLHARLLALYPLSEIVISIADAVTLDYEVDGDGNGWDDALDDLYDYRQASEPPDNVFFYGMMAPAATFASYCKTSCVLGYSVIADEDDVASRGSIGVTVFADGSGSSDAWDTVAHELGHALGRDHANCGLDLGDPPDPDDYDVDYPYPNAGMGGVYGFDFRSMRLVKPKSHRDVMSYCVPVWISDYTYRALDERLDHIAATRFRLLGQAPPTLERVARIRRDGTSRWLTERVRRAPAQSAPHSIALLDAGGLEVGRVRARFSRVDHAPGGYVSLPAQPLPAAAVAVDLRPLGGAILPL